MEVKTRVLLLIVLIVYKVASENFSRMKNFACRYPLYFRRKNVEAASIAGIFS